MAAAANTFMSTSAVGNREDIDNIVSRISPEDTPIYSSIEKGKAKATFSEWEVDELAAPAANAQAEGDEYSFAATTPPERIGNRTQIFRKTGIISGTQEAVDNVGNNEKLAEQKLKKGIEVRKDVELSIVANNASVDGTTRVSGGVPSFLETNVSRGSGGANGGYNSTTKLTVAETTGTARAFTKALLDNVIDQVFQSGGNARSLQLAPKLKTVFATFMADPNVAQLRTAVPARGNKTVLSGSVDVYQGPNGTVEVVGNRVMAPAAVARRGLILDFEMLEWLWLRKIQEDKDVAKTGDAKKFVMLGEGTLKVKNEAAHGVVADLTVPA
ncbi:MAG: head protein [Pelagibacterium sp. SCN 63-23]|nr:MAG: head protein [Pelagibacterium sp. SCN 63-23]